MILETIVSTIWSIAGLLVCAALGNGKGVGAHCANGGGERVDEAALGLVDHRGRQVFVTQPASVVCQAVGEGVVNITDNVLLFARCALEACVPPHRPALSVRGFILEDVCSWKELRVVESDLRDERGRFFARVVAEGRARDFLGFNRGKHAVIEATILATRLHLLGRAAVLLEIDRLRPLVAKTGGPDEREAFEFLAARVARANDGAADAG